MKNRTVQFLAICLSSAMLSGPVSMIAYAQDVDSEMDYPDPPEQDVDVEDEPVADAETIAYEACGAMEEAQEATQTAVDETADAVVVLENEDISGEEAQAIVDGASNSVDEAGEELQIAEEKYSQLVLEYDKAKQEYENAVLAYAVEKQTTQDSLQEAEGSLQEAELKLHELEQQIEDAKELVYQYTDADGQIVQLTEEEAEALNGQVEIADYWVIDGSYVPRYIEYMRYTGTRDIKRYSGKSAQQSGKEYVLDKYENNKDIYKTSVQFNEDWEINRDTKSRTYETTGTFTAAYNKASEKNGYAVSDAVKEGHYVSETAAVGAVIDEAKALHGAQTIDEQESKLVSTNIKEFSQIIKNYVYLGGDEAAYKMLLADAQDAKSRLEAAQEKVQSIKDKLDSLKDDDSLVALVQVTFLEAKLENATNSYNQAKENLDAANKNLQDAKAIYADKYQQTSEEDTPGVAPQETTPVETPQEENPVEDVVPEVVATDEIISDEKSAEDITEIEDTELEEKVSEKVTPSERRASQESYSTHSSTEDASLIKLPVGEDNNEITDVEEPDLSNIFPFMYYDSNKNNRSNNNNSGSGDSIISPIAPVADDPSIQSEEPITIPDAATPKDVTVKGLIQHRKWFVGLAGVSAVGGVGIGIFEFKRRAIAKILDKLNQ